MNTSKQEVKEPEQKHTHNPSKVSGICKDCGEQLMPEEVFND